MATLSMASLNMDTLKIVTLLMALRICRYANARMAHTPCARAIDVQLVVLLRDLDRHHHITSINHYGTRCTRQTTWFNSTTSSEPPTSRDVSTYRCTFIVSTMKLRYMPIVLPLNLRCNYNTSSGSSHHLYHHNYDTRCLTT